MSRNSQNAFCIVANLTQEQHGKAVKSPHNGQKTALLTPFHRDFAPQNISSNVGTHTAYYVA